MTLAPFFHIGLLVENLDRAMERYSDVLGVSFVEPAIAACELREPGRVEPCELRVTYSNQGPPYLELLEAQGDGVYGLHHGEGMHHLGVWEPDCKQRVDKLTTAQGLRSEATQFTPDGKIIVAYFYPNHLHGTRLEIVDEARRPMMETWISGGDFVP